MREYKFRAWNKLARKMAVIDALDFALDAYRAHAGKFSGSGHLADIELMQFTGLTDKTGKDIYEGDIVRLPNTDICHIEYKDTMFVATSISKKFPGCREYIYWHGDTEIIGNRYDDPELLKEEQA